MNIISVKNLGKKYLINSNADKHYKYKTLREELVNNIKKFPAHFFSSAGLSKDDFWALEDISFNVKKGERLGVIGLNGAGKSTLLKLISRITPPTTGEIILKGKTASLLEVGTGMHPELTGKENIFLNGAILGMKRKEIKMKFDEIISFAEIEKFIDTPVKHYSSGMYVRLAFSVAAHLDSDILIVDEVLAVGDAQFQKKCIGKLKDFSEDGRTIIFVSHDMGAIQHLCDNCILLSHGKMLYKSKTDEVIREYLKNSTMQSPQSLLNIYNRTGVGDIKFSKLELFDMLETPISTISTGMSAIIKLSFQVKTKNQVYKNSRVSILISNFIGQHMLLLSTEMYMESPLTITKDGNIKCIIPKFPLSKGTYYISIYLETNKVIQDYIFNQIELNVVDGLFFKTARQYPEGWAGKTVLIDHKWEY